MMRAMCASVRVGILLLFVVIQTVSGQTPGVKSKRPARKSHSALREKADQDSSGKLSWFERVRRTQAEQPHWITPLVTVTPRLEQEVRFDFFRQVQPGGSVTTVYGGGKGLELIPSERIEVILGIPSYIHHDAPGVPSGLGDTPFLVKYRILTSNEEGRNYILTAFLGVSAPTATNNNGQGHTIITPTVAFGKGWGPFDIQSTFGVGLPATGERTLGTPLAFNTALQYRVWGKLWPELELNSTSWPNGLKSGKKQAFLTPGLVIGRLPLTRRIGLTFGAGVQIAVTHFRPYNHNYILSLRLPF